MKRGAYKTDLLTKIEKAKNQEQNKIRFYSKAISFCKDHLSQLKKKVVLKSFESEEKEIHFFKVTKQKALHNFVYYSELKALELNFPKANKVSQKNYINDKIEQINEFFRCHREFVQYIEEESGHLDRFYFTRKFNDDFQISYTGSYFRDPEFSTSHDLLLAKVSAYGKLVTHHEKRLKKLESPNFNEIPKSQLKWTSSKAALTELTYALYHGGAVNNGNSDIREIAVALEHAFNFPIGDLYRTYSEIRSRKSRRAKFLDELSTSLISGMNSLDE